ncbi:MAG: zinc-finger domain-containing protein [Candidatus Symbiobacter sp.]|nr:zinc-finger domain-containing protein [Candidatus Symbiobacter sp.]
MPEDGLEPPPCRGVKKYDKVRRSFNLSAMSFIMPPPIDPPNTMSPSKNQGKNMPPLFTVTHKIFACDGGGGVMGHPKIYLDLSHSGRVDCPYCGRHFILVKNDHAVE